MNYIAKTTSKETKPGCWNYLDVAVFEVADDGTEKQVGSYERKYSSMYETFFPFKQKGKWYALYSSDYTATSVMSLPDCKQIATEKGNAYGFCPTGFYVPNKEDMTHNDHRHYDWHAKHRSEAHYAGLEKSHGKEHADKWRKWDKEEDESYDKVEDLYVGQFGFVSGCVWGDDSSWKLQYLDLSKITEGVITRTDRWGYWPLPDGKSIKECLDFEEIELPSFTQVKALKQDTISLMDRNFHNKNIGEVYKFADDSIFAGLTVKIKEIDDEGCGCDIIESKNTLAKTEIYLEDRFFGYTKPSKPLTRWQDIKRRLSYLFTGAF